MKKGCGSAIGFLFLIMMPFDQGFPQISDHTGIAVSNTMGNSSPTLRSSGLEKRALEKSGHSLAEFTSSGQSFDWTQYTILRLYFTSPEGRLVHNTVPPPMYDNYCKAFANFFIYPTQKIDTYPEEGWVLLYKDFGDSSRPAAGDPLFILYNKYRGIMRVFFYNATGGASSYGVMRLDFVGSNSTSLVTFNSALPQFSDQYGGTADGTISFSSIVAILPSAWCYADFNITGYDRDIADKTCYFRLSIYGINASSYDEALLYPVNLLLNSDEFVNLETPCSALTTHLTNLDEEITHLGALYEKMQSIRNGATAGTWYASALDSINASASLDRASWITKLSSIAGRVRSFAGPLVGPEEFYPTFSLDMQDIIALQNTILTVLPRVQFPLIPIPGTINSPDTVYHGAALTYCNPLGIFNVNTQPVIGYCFKTSSYQANSGTRPSYLFGNRYFGLDSPLQISYNPYDSLKLISAKTAFVDISHGPRSAYYSVEKLTGYKFSMSDPSTIAGSASYVRQAQPGTAIDGPKNGIPTEVALQLEFSYYNALFGKPDTVYFLKTYPAKLLYDPAIADRVLGSSGYADSTLAAPGNPSVLSSFVVGNYHNTFNPATSVEYQLGTASMVTITVYNLLGQKVAVLQDRTEPAGVHSAMFDGSGFASGVYFLDFEAQPQDGTKSIVQTRKLMLVK